MLNYFPAEQQLLQLRIGRLTVGHDRQVRLLQRMHIAFLYDHAAIDRGDNELAATARAQLQATQLQQADILLLRKDLQRFIRKARRQNNLQEDFLQ
ncbi:hypothetical protein D3C74_353910 [compost metagenome]